MKTNALVSPKLQAKLKKADPDVQNIVLVIHKKNTKLQKEVAELEVENMSLRNRIKAIPEMDKQVDKKNTFENTVKRLSNEDLAMISKMLKNI